MWYRPAAAAPGENHALVDIGDKRAGLSRTIVDGGMIGDDTLIGRRDDLLVRIGGLNSPGSGTVMVDLPNMPAVDVLSLAVTRDVVGDLIVYVNGIEQARVLAAGVDAGLDQDWSFLAPLGPIGGSDGPGVLPFDATRFVGTFAGFGILDRALARNEVEADYARYTSYIYCQGRANTTGAAAKLSFSGLSLIHISEPTRPY